MMNRGDALYRIQFDHDRTANQQVHTPLTDRTSYIAELNRGLRYEWDTSYLKLDFHRSVVCRFMKPWAELAVHFNRCANHAFG